MADDDLLASLRKQIGDAKSAGGNENEPASSSGLGQGLRLSVELMAGVAVGCLIGYGLDYVFGTKPIFFIICFFLGTAGGFKNMLREAQKIADKEK